MQATDHPAVAWPAPRLTVAMATPLRRPVPRSSGVFVLCSVLPAPGDRLAIQRSGALDILPDDDTGLAEFALKLDHHRVLTGSGWLHLGALLLDTGQGELRFGDKRLALSALEVRLLCALARARGEDGYVPPAALAEQLGSTVATVRNMAGHLGEKARLGLAYPELIEAAYGRGYRIRDCLHDGQLARFGDDCGPSLTKR